MMTLAEALAGKEIPDEVRDGLGIIAVPYVDFEDKEREGQLVVHAEIVPEVQKIFATLFEMRFPIAQMVPIVAHDWDDDVSMTANNTSAFNYRLIHGTSRLSKHSFGRAIDINPVQNPYQRRDGKIMPIGSSYDVTKHGTITEDIAAVFKAHGWKWGGDWTDPKDWQHFEKPK